MVVRTIAVSSFKTQSVYNSRELGFSILQIARKINLFEFRSITHCNNWKALIKIFRFRIMSMMVLYGWRQLEMNLDQSYCC